MTHGQWTPTTSPIKPCRQDDFRCCCCLPELWHFLEPIATAATRHHFDVLLVVVPSFFLASCSIRILLLFHEPVHILWDDPEYGGMVQSSITPRPRRISTFAKLDAFDRVNSSLVLEHNYHISFTTGPPQPRKPLPVLYFPFPWVFLTTFSYLHRMPGTFSVQPCFP